jgi:hypothetical protein
MLPTRRGYRASYQIVVGVNQFMILNAQKREKVNVLFQEFDRLGVSFNWDQIS